MVMRAEPVVMVIFLKKSDEQRRVTVTLLGQGDTDSVIVNHTNKVSRVQHFPTSSDIGKELRKGKEERSLEKLQSQPG